MRTEVHPPSRGGKDGHPHPVDRETHDRTIETLRQAVERAKVGQRERLDALRRLANMDGEPP